MNLDLNEVFGKNSTALLVVLGIILVWRWDVANAKASTYAAQLQNAGIAPQLT